MIDTRAIMAVSRAAVSNSNAEMPEYSMYHLQGKLLRLKTTFDSKNK